MRNEPKRCLFAIVNMQVLTSFETLLILHFIGVVSTEVRLKILNTGQMNLDGTSIVKSGQLLNYGVQELFENDSFQRLQLHFYVHVLL